MDADFSIDLGLEDPILDFPWSDPSGRLAYVDLKRHPELIVQIEEAAKFPELGEFLEVLNSAPSIVETAKCDAWATTDLSAEEDIYEASHKLSSYVDVVFSETNARLSLATYEQFARKLVGILRCAPEAPSAAELCILRCYFQEDDDSDIREGFYFTLYVSGYGTDGGSARRHWAAALKWTANALIQLSTGDAA